MSLNYSMKTTKNTLGAQRTGNQERGLMTANMSL